MEGGCGDVEMADGDAGGGGSAMQEGDEDDEILREWSRRLVKWVPLVGWTYGWTCWLPLGLFQCKETVTAEPPRSI